MIITTDIKDNVIAVANKGVVSNTAEAIIKAIEAMENMTDKHLSLQCLSIKRLTRALRLIKISMLFFDS